jgi:lipopolysaccharide transport system ATP-binding protein
MQDVSKGHGRTVLFVSHNMQAIQSLCSTTILMEQGAITMYGQTESIINKYLSHNSENKSEQEWDEASYPGNEFISVRSVKIKSESKTLYVTTPFEIEIVFRCLNQDSAINVSLVLKSIKDEIICNDSTQSKQLNSKWQRAVIKIPGNFLNDNVYTIDNYFVKDRSSVLFVHNEPITFEVHDTPRENTSWYGKWVGAVRPKFDWEYEEITEL